MPNIENECFVFVLCTVRKHFTKSYEESDENASEKRPFHSCNQKITLNAQTRLPIAILLAGGSSRSSQPPISASYCALLSTEFKLGVE